MVYSWQKTTDTPSTNSGKYSWQTGNLQPTLTEKVNTQKEVLKSKGLPISTRSDRAEPTVIGGLIRDSIKPFANIASNIIQAGQLLTTGKYSKNPLSNDYLGKVEGLGQADLSKMPFEKNNLKTIIKSVGTGAEIASYLGAGGAAKDVTTNIFKQPLKQFIKSEGINLAKEGAIQGLSYSLGTQGQEFADTGKPLSLTKTLTDTAISSVLTPIIGAGVNKLFGKKLVKEGEKVINPIINKVDEIAQNSLSKSTTSIKEGTVNYLKENPSEIANKEVRLREVDGNIVIEDGIDTLEAAKQTGITPVFKDVTSEYTGKQSKKIQNLIESNKPINNSPKTITGIEKQSELPPSIQQVNVAPEVITKDVEQMKNSIEGFDEGTFKQWSKDLRSIPIDELKNVGLGGEKTIQNTIPRTAYYATLKNIAKETNDVNLSQMLANSPIPSKSGQELVANKLSQGENLVDDLIAIKKVRAKAVGLSDQRYEAEAKSWFDKISNKIETMKQQIPTVQEVEDIITNNLICK